MALVIALYEEEKSRLEFFIKECLESFEGPEYLLASHHQEALFQVNHTIRMLNRMDDANYDEKEFNIRMIERVQSDLEKVESDYLRKYYEEQLKRYQDKQEKLNLINKHPKDKRDENIFENALSDLLAKRIRKFKIVFNRSKNIYLEISVRGKIIKLIVNVPKRAVHSSYLELLEKLRFKLNSKRKWFFYMEVIDEEAVSKLKFLLIRVIFDILYPYQELKNAFIEF